MSAAACSDLDEARSRLHAECEKVEAEAAKLASDRTDFGIAAHVAMLGRVCGLRRAITILAEMICDASEPRHCVACGGIVDPRACSGTCDDCDADRGDGS